MLRSEGYLDEATDDKVTLQEAIELAERRGVLGTTGGATLSAAALRACFLAARVDPASRVLGVLEITGDELILCLAHAGHTMYKDVRELTFAGKLEAFFQNLLGRKTPAEVLASLTKATAAPRFDPVKMPARAAGESESDHAEWLQIFASLRLDDLPGFPAWEQGVYSALHAHWPTILSIFTYACKHNLMPATAADSGLRLSAQGWVSLLKQCGVPTKAFPEARLLQLFARVAERRAGRKPTAAPLVAATPGFSTPARSAAPKSLSDPTWEAKSSAVSSSRAGAVHGRSRGDARLLRFAELLVRSFGRANPSHAGGKAGKSTARGRRAAHRDSVAAQRDARLSACAT